MQHRNLLQHLVFILAFVAMLGCAATATAQIDSTKINAAGGLPDSYCPNLNDQWYSTGQMPPGYYKSGANCIPIPACSWGTQWNGSWCADICGAGTRWNGSWCESICGPGTQWNGSGCVAVCPAGTQWNGSSCVSVCGSGYTWNGAGCVFDISRVNVPVYYAPSPNDAIWFYRDWGVAGAFDFGGLRSSPYLTNGYCFYFKSGYTPDMQWYTTRPSQSVWFYDANGNFLFWTGVDPCSGHILDMSLVARIAYGAYIETSRDFN